MRARPWRTTDNQRRRRTAAPTTVERKPTWPSLSPSGLTPRTRRVAVSSERIRFYRAMLCIHGTSHGPVSVRVRLCLSVSVTSRSSTKTAKRRITQTTSHDSTGTLVFGCQRSPRNSTGITPCGGAKYRLGESKSATFDK